MNQYEVTFNKSGEITKLNTEAETHYTAIMKCLVVMAKKYGITKNSMIRDFNCEKIKMECHEIKNGFARPITPIQESDIPW